MKRKPFRFAWNGQVFSKQETRWLLGTFIAIVATLLVVILAGTIERMIQ